MAGPFQYSVFTKPWRMPLPKLAKYVQTLGFDGVELPVRSGFQVEPEKVQRGLPKAAKILADHGLKIFSVAGPADERTIAACAKAGVPILRVCVGIQGTRYLAEEVRLWRECDAVVPLLQRYGVTLGIQNHCGRSISGAMQLRHFIEKYDPRHIAAVWDAAHNALGGEEPELAIDIVWGYLRMVNLKNAIWRQKNGPEAEYAEWETYWTSGRRGLASWPRVASELKRRNWTGVVCLTAEYSDPGAVNRLIEEDCAFAKALFDR